MSRKKLVKKLEKKWADRKAGLFGFLLFGIILLVLAFYIEPAVTPLGLVDISLIRLFSISCLILGIIAVTTSLMTIWFAIGEISMAKDGEILDECIFCDIEKKFKKSGVRNSREILKG